MRRLLANNINPSEYRKNQKATETDQANSFEIIAREWLTKYTDQWTPERRKRQAQLIKTWQPWKQSTGLKTRAGKAVASKNAYKGASELDAQLKLLKKLIKEQQDFVAEL